MLCNKLLFFFFFSLCGVVCSSSVPVLYLSSLKKTVSCFISLIFFFIQMISACSSVFSHLMGENMSKLGWSWITLLDQALFINACRLSYVCVHVVVWNGRKIWGRDAKLHYINNKFQCFNVQSLKIVLYVWIFVLPMQLWKEHLCMVCTSISTDLLKQTYAAIIQFNNTIPFISEICYAQLSSTTFCRDVELWKGISQLSCVRLKGMSGSDSQLSCLEHVKQDTQSVVLTAEMCDMFMGMQKVLGQGTGPCWFCVSRVCGPGWC